MAQRPRKVDSRQLPLDLGDVLASSLAPFIPGKDAVFFATLPAPDMARRLSGFAAAQRRRHGLTGKPRPWHVLHLTLHGLGRPDMLSSELIERAKRAAGAIRMSCFRIALDRLKSFHNNGSRPLVLCGDEGVLGLEALHEALGTALSDEGLALGGQAGFTPHATLLYDRKSVGETLLDEPFAWIVKNFVLVHSRYGKTEYQVLGDWPLLGPVGRA